MKATGRKMINIVKELSAHICIICSLVLLVIKILDWYNPFMDFMGRSEPVQYLLCIGALILGVMQTFKIGRRKRKVRS